MVYLYIEILFSNGKDYNYIVETYNYKINLENVMLTKRSQTQKVIWYKVSFLNSKKGQSKLYQ